jgi:hypothetical protein
LIRIACLLSAAFAASCGQAPRSNAGERSFDRVLEPAPRERYADDVSRFLAGLPAKPGSRLAELHETAEWLHHRDQLDPAWERVEREQLAAMRDFWKQELSQPVIAGSTIFYPFSGPDALMVTAFFPHSPAYVMVGLEPAGTLPAPKQFERKNLKKYLAGIRATVASELGRSFFITRQMDRQFRGQVTDGLLLPILELLVRSGHTVLGFRYVRLDDSGQIIERASDYHAPGKIGNKGVQIDFQTDEDGSVHKLVYFSVNLSDKMLRDNKPFLDFASRLQGVTTFLKATSYMTHKQQFSIIRDQILTDSAAVLQDDSGIPYRFFLTPAWRVQLYGSYVRPYGSFRWLEQPDLRKAYLTLSPKPLTFRIGYGYSRVPSNLLLATRVK